MQYIMINLYSGLFAKNRCPRGRNCNFLHVYRNPDDWSEQRSENLRYNGNSWRHEELDKRRYSDRSSDRSRNRNGDKSGERDSYRYDRDYKDRRRRRRSRSRSHSDDDNYRKKKRRHRSRSRSNSEERDREQLSKRSVANGEVMKENESRTIKSTKDNGNYNIQNFRSKSQSPCNSSSPDSDRCQHRRKSKKKHKKRKRRSKAHGNTVNNSDVDTT